MAVVGLVLADDDQVHILLEVGEGVDMWFIDVFGVLEAGMEDGAVACEPRVYQNCECAGEAMWMAACREGWRESEEESTITV